MTCLLRKGDEYDGIFPAWDWQRLPGTTCAKTTVPEPPGTVDRPTSATAVGGVSDGIHGACTQDLLNEALTISKSWFFGPDVVVCLGAGHRKDLQTAVATTIDQSLLQGPVHIDDSPASLGMGRHSPTEARQLAHGPWRFSFLNPVNLTIELGPRRGDWSWIGSSAGKVLRDIFQADIKPAPGSLDIGYAYSISAVGLKPEAHVVIENSRRLQAVWWPLRSRLQAALHEPGMILLPGGETLTMDRACCLQLARENAKGWRLDLADISQEELDLTAVLTRPDGTIAFRHVIMPPTGDRAGETRSLALSEQ